jgi:hypothetical protein
MDGSKIRHYPQFWNSPPKEPLSQNDETISLSGLWEWTLSSNGKTVLPSSRPRDSWSSGSSWFLSIVDRRFWNRPGSLTAVHREYLNFLYPSDLVSCLWVKIIKYNVLSMRSWIFARLTLGW